MANGKRIAIKNMDDRHLYDTIRFVQRCRNAAEDVSTLFDNDDVFVIASEAAEAMDGKLDELVAEANRRGLRW